MFVSAGFTVRMLTNYLILSFYHFYYVFGEKPRCKGDPLNADEFSSKEHVGFVRDICVDEIARNLYNMLKIPPSSLCEELANIRTSTCSPKCLGGKCIKWNRSRFYNNGVTNLIINKAVALIKDFNEVVWKNTLLSFEEEKSIFDWIVDAEQDLIDSKAVTMDSKLIDELRRLKNNFCTRCVLNQNQRAYQESIKKTDAKTMDKLNILVCIQELGTAIKLFIRKYEAKNMVQITKFYIKTDLSHGGSFLFYTFPNLKFEFKKEGNPLGIMYSTVLMIIPALFPIKDRNVVKNICHREALFYDEILPKLYELGKCNSFAPKPYAVTEDNAVVLENIGVRGYKNGDQINLLNWNQIEVSLALLAKFHALSYIYLQKFGEDPLTVALVRSFPHSIVDGGTHLLYAFYQIVKPTLSPSLYEKVRNMENKFLTEHLTKKREDKNSMNVIIHGEYRISNIFFKNDDNDKLMEPMLLDWQLSRETSPVVDLICFFISSVPIEIFETKDDALKDFYLQKLNDVLSALKSDRVYERPELDNDMEYYKYYYLRVLCINRQQMFDSDKQNEQIEAYKLNAP